VVENNLHAPGPPCLAVLFITGQAGITESLENRPHSLEILDLDLEFGSDLDWAVVGNGTLEGQDAKVAVTSQSEHATAT